MLSKLEKAKPLVEEIRNSLGGHVLQRSVELALNNMALDRWGYIEVGDVLGKTHYKFTGELVGEILLAGVPETERENELGRQFKTIAELLPVFELTDILLMMYIRARKLDE